SARAAKWPRVLGSIPFQVQRAHVDTVLQRLGWKPFAGGSSICGALCAEGNGVPTLSLGFFLCMVCKGNISQKLDTAHWLLNRDGHANEAEILSAIPSLIHAGNAVHILLEQMDVDPSQVATLSWDSAMAIAEGVASVAFKEVVDAHHADPTPAVADVREVVQHFSDHASQLLSQLTLVHYLLQSMGQLTPGVQCRQSELVEWFQSLIARYVTDSAALDKIASEVGNSGVAHEDAGTVGASALPLAGRQASRTLSRLQNEGSELAGVDISLTGEPSQPVKALQSLFTESLGRYSELLPKVEAVEKTMLPLRRQRSEMQPAHKMDSVLSQISGLLLPNESISTLDAMGAPPTTETNSDSMSTLQQIGPSQDGVRNSPDRESQANPAQGWQELAHEMGLRLVLLWAVRLLFLVAFACGNASLCVFIVTRLRYSVEVALSLIAALNVGLALIAICCILRIQSRGAAAQLEWGGSRIKVPAVVRSVVGTVMSKAPSSPLAGERNPLQAEMRPDE
ncbi:unnamed protein product, partial [Ostreobium quekettii]